MRKIGSIQIMRVHWHTTNRIDTENKITLGVAVRTGMRKIGILQRIGLVGTPSFLAVKLTGIRKIRLV